MASTYLTRTYQSGGNRKKWTISMWVKRSKIGDSTNHMLFQSYVSTYTYCPFDTSDRLHFQDGNGGAKTTSMKFRDTNAWYHIVVAIDTDNSTADDRYKIYVNGERITTFDTSSNPSSGYEGEWNKAQLHNIGRHSSGVNFYDGLMSHIHFCDGYQYQASDFGSTDAITGEWKINTAPSVSYGTTGFFILKDGDSITDQSGNSNNWTANGTLTKSEDNPSNIFATWNPLWCQSTGNVGDVTFSHGNLTTISAVNYRTTPTTLGMSSTGKYYWEIKRNETGADTHFGVMSENATPANTATWIGNAANGWIISGDNGQLYTGGTGGSTLSGGTVGNGEVFMGAYDGTTGKLYFGKDGAWAGSANPETGANPAYTLDTSLIYFPVVSTGGDVSANFGNGYFGTTAISSAGTNASNIGLFEYNVPTGFTAISTKGINSF